MKIATWNLRHGLDLRTDRVDLAAVASRVAELDVAALAVQEVDRGLPRTGGVDQVAELAAALGWHGVFAPALLGDPGGRWHPVPAGGDPGGPAYGIGLLSRYPLHGIHRYLLPGANRRCLMRGWDGEPRVLLRAELGTTDLVLATTHLSFLPWRGRRQLRAGLRWAAAAGCSVLLGDLNLSHRMLSPVLAGTPWAGRATGPTFPACRPGWTLDHILTRPGLLQEAWVGRGGPSDHLPVVGQLATPGP